MTGQVAEHIVITFKLRRQEYPRLFGNLAGIAKGPARAARLKALVVQGFSAEQALPGASAGPRQGNESPPKHQEGLFDDLIAGSMES